jgi:hypothetical protein
MDRRATLFGGGHPVQDASWLASTLGLPRFGWLSFQTLWGDIAAGDPDLRD